MSLDLISLSPRTEIKEDQGELCGDVWRDDSIEVRGRELRGIMNLSVTIRTYTTDFYLFWCTDTGVIVTHAFIFLPASGPIVLVDSCAVRCCDSELRLTVHYCAL